MLVTGASSGIGEATARLMAASGVRVVLVSEQEAPLHAVADSIEAAGGKAFPLVADFARSDQVEGLVSRAEQLAGPLAVLVNNAGVGMRASVTEMRMEDLRLLFEINFFALTSLSRQALTKMAERRAGRIINVSSAMGQFGCADFSAYAATKGAVHAFTQALRVEAQMQGVHVSEIVPISVRTQFFDNVKGKAYRPVGIVLTTETVANRIMRCATSRRPPPEIWPYYGIRAVFILNAMLPGVMLSLNRRNYQRQIGKREEGRGKR